MTMTNEEQDQVTVVLCSTLTAVTVFRDCAQLTYVTDVSLGVGTHTLLVRGEKGWKNALEKTLQVRVKDVANQQVTLRAASFKSRVRVKDAHEREREEELKKTRDELQKSLEAISDRETINRAVKEACDQIEAKLTHMGERGVGPSARADVELMAGFLSNPASWSNLTRFIVDRKRRVAESSFALSEQMKELEAKERAVLKALDALCDDRHPERREMFLELIILVKEHPVELKLFLSFCITGASWEPLYDIHVEPTQSRMDITYYAQVRQNTSMDWTRVQMRLSTATPHSGPYPPLFQSWNISLGAPVGPCVTTTTETPNVSRRTARSLSAPSRDIMPRTAKVEKAAVSSTFISSTFHVVGSVTVRSDNKPVRVTITTHTLSVEWIYHAVPKYNPSTHLLVKTKNVTPYVLLPGRTNAFVDNTFVGNSRLELVPTGAEFTIPLCADDCVKVTRIQVRRMRSTLPRLMRQPCTLLEYVYEFTVKSSLPGRALLVLSDQYPISPDSDVLVNLNEPCMREISDGKTADGFDCSVDATGVVEWRVHLPVGVFTRVLRFAFQVMHPENKSVLGLEDE